MTDTAEVELKSGRVQAPGCGHASERGRQIAKGGCRVCTRGLHSSTSWLNVSALCGIGGALRGCLVGVRGHEGVSRVYLVQDMAQLELNSGPV